MGKNRAKNPAVANSEDADVEAPTVFVRNLPYTLTGAQLEEMFSEIGPVRRSFIVKEKGSDQGRGFGYVQFAVLEDAIRAVEMKNGTDLHGRKVMLKFAQRRPSFEERRTEKQPNGKRIKEETESVDTTSNRPSILEKSEKQQLAAAMSRNNEDDIMNDGRKLNDDHKFLRCEKAVSEKEQSVSAFKTREKRKLNGVKFDNVEVETQKRKKRHLDAVDTGEYKKRRKKVEAFGDGESPEKQKVARTVILGGLASAEMREVVLEVAQKVGPVESVQSSLSSQELKGRGLERDGCKVGAAAVIFKSAKVANQAVAELHQKPLGGGIVWARQLGGEGSKPRKWRVIIRNLPFSITEEKVRELLASAGFVWEAKVPKKEDGQAKGFAFASFTSKANAEKAIRLMNGKIVQKRQIAVDWAVERRAYEQAADAGAKLENRVEAVPSDIEDEETASEDEGEDFTDKLAFPHERLGSGHGKEEWSTSLDEIDLAKKVLNRLASSALSNKPEDNIDLDIAYGDANKSKHHSDPKTADEEKTKRSDFRDLAKTVFIKNLPVDVDADTLKKYFSTFGKVKSAILVLHSETKRPKGTAFLEFWTVEDAEAALAASTSTTVNMEFAKGITLGGKRVEVLKAVEKKSAEAIEKAKLEPAVVDRRNLYLLEEGKIERDTPAAYGVSEEDMSKRRELEIVKSIKLKSPDFHVSRTRLAVNNVPKSMQEVELKKLFIDAVKSRATKQEPFIEEVRILKDVAKGAKSRGVAFVEFAEHEHALVALRVLNNNPEIFSPHRRPIIGFAIINVQTLRKRQERQLGAGHKHSIDDQEASFKGKQKLKRRGEKSRISKEQAVGDGRKASMHKTKEMSAVNAQKLADLDANGNPKGNKKSRPEVFHTEPENFAGKRKKNAGRNLNSFDGELDRIHKRPPSKIQKVPTGKAKGIEASFMRTNGGHAHHKAQGVQQIATQKRKGSKFEVEDKLEKLVAVYRDKYFLHVSKGAKESDNSTGVKASNDFKRWFE